ncbi:MAG: TlpA family protein disulfide reductase, partial [Winogradskyella sp.]
MKKLLTFAIALILFSCANEKQTQTLKNGFYRVTIGVQDNKELPFNIEVTSPTTLKIYNADEVVEVDEIEYRNDSVFIKPPVFKSYFAGVFDGDNLKGDYINKTRKRITTFKAEYNNDKRFYP